MKPYLLATLAAALLLTGVGPACANDDAPTPGPGAAHQQLPQAMHSRMHQRPRIRVGVLDADLIGSDNRTLQAAVDYIAAFGGGVVEIGPGEYTMHDSLHLRSGVAVVGAPSGTVLRKAPAAVSALAVDGDFGEEQFTVEHPKGFDVSCGVAIWDDRARGFHTTVARITGRRENAFSIDKPLMADCTVRNGAQAATVFPVVSGYDLTGVRVENLAVEGAKQHDPYLDGCRGAGVYLYRCHGAIVRNCTVRNYSGDGVSFQQSNDVQVISCTSEGNTHLGIHPGSGSQRPIVRGCAARTNGADGLYLCWRVQGGLFEDNLIERNGGSGVSIGHKDTDNLLQRNRVADNREDGFHFRNESYGMAPHRNRLLDNLIENNGAAGVHVRGEVDGLLLERNIILDARPDEQRTQAIGVLLEQSVRDITLRDNKIDAGAPVDDRRKTSAPPSK